MHTNAFISIAVTVLVLGFIIYRQLRPRRLSSRGLWLTPTIILFFIEKSLQSFHPNSTKLIEIAITAVLSLVLGLLACRQLKVYADPHTGKAMASGSWTYFLWWLAAFVVKSALAVAFGETSLKNVSDVEILTPVFFLMVTRNVFLYQKARKLELKLH